MWPFKRKPKGPPEYFYVPTVALRMHPEDGRLQQWYCRLECGVTYDAWVPMGTRQQYIRTPGEWRYV